jgi:branched-chain amino acid transport system substrate-binding protein
METERDMRSAWQPWLLVTIGFGLTVLLVAPAGGQQGTSAPSEIKIGTYLPITGPMAGFGKYGNWGYKYAVDQVNKDGGIFIKAFNKKLPVKLIILDTESKSEKVAAHAERLILNNGVVALLGGMGPPEALPGAAVAERQKVPVVGGPCPLESFRHARPQWNYAWDIFFDENDMTTQQFKAVDMVSSNKKVALFTDNEEDGVVMSKLWVANAPKFGYQVVYRANFPVGTTDYGDIIRKAQASGADIMIAQMIPPDTIALWRQMESLNWKPKAAFLEKGGEVVEFWQAVGKSGQGVGVVGFWHPDMNYPGSKELVEAFEKDTKEKYSQHIATTMVIAQVLMKAIEKAGTLDREAINKAIPEAAASQTWTIGTLKFNADHTAALPTVMLQWQDGDTYIVSPKEKATKPFIYPLPSWAELKK